MPSDANGVYSLPPGYLAVTGETIQASQHNPPLEDLASAMSARLMRSGAAPMTGPLKLVDGSAGAPALRFNNSTGTGFYKTTNGIGVSIDGTKVAEFLTSGVSRFIGELIPWSMLDAPSGCVLPYGQTLSRTTYAALWEKAQTEIENGNTFYNNGNGSTTFGIGDMRGRCVAGKDDMGGAAAERLTTDDSGLDGVTLGSAGGVESEAITQSTLPNYNLAVTISQQAGYTTNAVRVTGTTNITYGGGSGPINVPTSLSAADITPATPLSLTVSMNGGGNPYRKVQPTMVLNWLLYAGA